MSRISTQVLACLLLVLTACRIDAEPGPSDVHVLSPDGKNGFSLLIDEAGQPRYTVTRGSETVVNDSLLGLRFVKQEELGKGFSIAGMERARRDETWRKLRKGVIEAYLNHKHDRDQAVLAGMINDFRHVTSSKLESS